MHTDFVRIKTQKCKWFVFCVCVVLEIEGVFLFGYKPIQTEPTKTDSDLIRFKIFNFFS